MFVPGKSINIGNVLYPSILVNAPSPQVLVIHPLELTRRAAAGHGPAAWPQSPPNSPTNWLSIVVTPFITAQGSKLMSILEH